MWTRPSKSGVIVFIGLILLLMAFFAESAAVGPAAVLAGVTPTRESPVDTPVPPTATPIPPTNTPVPPTATFVCPTRTPWTPRWPTPTPVPMRRVFIPIPATGGRPVLGVPLLFWQAGLGLILIGLGLAWRRTR